MFTAKAATWGTRGGRLIVNGTDIRTPNFIVLTTRGAVDHLTPDHAPLAPVAGVYAEDLYDYDGLVESLCADRRRLPISAGVFLGACRAPGSRPITNKPNTHDSIGIDTVQGSRLAPLTMMADFMGELRPDLFLVPYDAPAQSLEAKIGANRMRKMEQRSIMWLERFVLKRLEIGSNSSEMMLIARIPPELRTEKYMSDIDESCDAYCFTQSEVGKDLSEVEPVGDAEKMRLSDSKHTNWRDVLNDIAQGFDLVHVPLAQFSDAGEALTLKWNVSEPSKPLRDLHDPQFTTDMTELGSTGHACAYIHHLLEADEMTAQVLLQQHNLSVISELFEGVRDSVEHGSFEADALRFLTNYGL